MPPTPSVSTNNILFYFNSFENNQYNDILQPVLQVYPHTSSLSPLLFPSLLSFLLMFIFKLNNGVAGWTLASWYGSGSQFYHSTPAPVNPGDAITGVIELQGSTWNILGTSPSPFLSISSFLPPSAPSWKPKLVSCSQC